MAYNRLKQAQYRQNQIGVDFIACPSQDQVRVFITGQILSAQNFPNTNLFISYKITLPQGWKTQISQKIYEADLIEQEIKQLNCLESITQSVCPVVQKNDDGSVINKFYFCFPIDLQLLANQKSINEQWPCINFEVHSKDFWDRVFIHGVGFIRFPRLQGTHELTFQTWKPQLQISKKVEEFFIGGLVRPKNLQEISKSYKINEMDQSGPINRYLYKTISSGSIKIRLNIATQSKKIKTKERINYKAQKFSQQVQLKKSEVPSILPSMVNTGTVLGGRFTTTRL